MTSLLPCHQPECVSTRFLRQPGANAFRLIWQLINECLIIHRPACAIPLQITFQSCIVVVTGWLAAWYCFQATVFAEDGRPVVGDIVKDEASQTGQVAQSADLLETQQRPNVIVILTDDQGWGDLSCHGNTNLSTTHLDSLARVGARFDRFFVAPVCAPTRAEFLTGRAHPRSGVLGVSEGKERMNLDERTIAEDFRAAGYRTACYGKWHNGTQYPYHPLARGFQEFYGFTAGHWGHYFDPPLEHDGRRVKGQGYLVDDLTDRAIQFIESNQQQNFFLYLAIPTPHTPMQVPDKYWQRHKDRKYSMSAPEEEGEDINFTRAAMAMVENIDDNVGRVLNRLDQLKLSRRTILVFFSDNGPNSYRWNAGMKGRKGSTDEGGVRSPLFISWPGKIPSGKLIPQICTAVDLLPTLADLAEVPLTKRQPLDGVSLKPLLSGEKVSLGPRTIFSHWSGMISARTQQYRLDAKGHLFDMVADPEQTRDLSEQLPEVTKQLSAQIDQWKQEVLGSRVNPLRPFTVGHPDRHETTLPARDGIPRGQVRRSSKAPNCSYFTGWTDSGDTITWKVDVLEAGRFAVDMYYTCPESSVGTQIELQMADHIIKQEVILANNPPLIGSQQDRVSRTTESYVKDFKPMSLGVIELPFGTGSLTLRAPEIVGTEGVDVKMLVLRRVP
jgi:arylsulfatase A-like enzyme